MKVTKAAKLCENLCKNICEYTLCTSNSYSPLLQNFLTFVILRDIQNSTYLTLN